MKWKIGDRVATSDISGRIVNIISSNAVTIQLVAGSRLGWDLTQPDGSILENCWTIRTHRIITRSTKIILRGEIDNV